MDGTWLLASTEIEQALLSLATAIAAGVILVAIAHKINLSAIVLLLLGGICLGPQGLGVVQPGSLRALPAMVSLAVGLILFEGGLTLDIGGYRSASRVIVRLLTVGVLTTWLITALLIRLLFGYSFGFCMLAASLVIVTGPTVIGPLLRRIRIHPTLHSILHWEGVLIDPIGVFIAILCFEFFGGTGGQAALTNFGFRVLTGMGLGIAGGLLLSLLIRRRVVDESLIDVVPLAFAAGIFGIAEALASESGLLATTVAGFVLGASRPAELKQIRRFKSAITDILIGMLFILLSARLEFDQFREFGFTGALLVVLVMILVRPADVLVSTLGEPLERRQRLFLSWVAPRGIVAASMSSLFALNLMQRGVEDARFVETFTYSVIIATILVQGFTAGALARRLGLQRPSPTGWLIVGAGLFARRVAEFIRHSAEVPVMVMDLNARAVAEARAAGLNAVLGDAREVSIYDERLDVQEMGHLLALTDNEHLNSLLCERWAEHFGRQKVFGWVPAGQGKQRGGNLPLVWQKLPRPSTLSHEIAEDKAWLRTIPLAPGGKSMSESLLLAAGGGAVWADLSARRPVGGSTELSGLVLQRRLSYLVDALRPGLFVRVQPGSMEELLGLLVDRLVAEVPQLPAKQLLEGFLERERVFSSSIGHGVAIPHAYHKAATARLCALAQLPEGLRLPGPDDTPVRLVFLLVGPPGDPEGHLAMIAEIARMVAEENVRERLMNAPGFADLLVVIRQAQAAG